MYKDYEIKLNAILDKHGVQKVELKDIKTLDKLESEAKKIIAELRKTKSKEKKHFQESTKVSDDSEKLYKKANELDKKIKEMNIVTKKAYDDYQETYGEMQVVAKKGESKADELEKNIKLVEKAAKNLGVNVPIDKYKTIQKNLETESNIPDKRKVYFTADENEYIANK